jgi:hypothetical protein
MVLDDTQFSTTRRHSFSFVDDDQAAAVSPNAAQDQTSTNGVLIKKWEELS